MLIYFLFIQALLIAGQIWYIKKRNEHESSLLAQKIESSTELKRTMAMGLALRFNYPKKKNEQGEIVFEKGSNIFLKETPFDFEDFVAKLFRDRFGGEVYITPKSGDFGVDFEHTREDGLYLGQVKAYKEDMDYTPIALVHSNMVKRNASGGYVITTSGFTKPAKEYARGLNIELIDGEQLVQYWLETMESTVYVPKGTPALR